MFSATQRPAAPAVAGITSPGARPQRPAWRHQQLRVVTTRAAEGDEAAPAPPANVCKTCGIPLNEAPRGCDGSGRVAGGIGAVAPWFPIKAYRPCPGLAQKGMQYERKGQITNNILFGEGRRGQ